MVTFLNITYSAAPDRSFIRPPSTAVLALCLLLILAALPAAPVAAQGSAAPAPVHITEVFYDTPGADAEEEWVELANLGTQPVDLSGFRVGDEEERGGGEGMLQFPPGTVLEPGQIIVIAQSARGFSRLHARSPDFEIVDSDNQVPDMLLDTTWASGSFALANDGDELLLLDANLTIVDAVNYGDKFTFFAPSVATVGSGASIARRPASCDTDSAAEWQPMATPAPGAIDLTGECSRQLVPLDAVQAIVPIGQIQGAGDHSPLVDRQVTFEGIVSGIHEDQNSAGIIYYTLFVQDLPGQEDGDPATADAVAVFHGRRRPPYRPGDHLQISGTVTEYYGLTEIDDRGLQIDPVSSDNALPAPILLAQAAGDSSTGQDWEAYESMLVTLAQPARIVGPTHSGCGFAVIDANTPALPLPRRHAADQALRPFLILHHSDVDCNDLPLLKKGDQVSGLSGPLTFNFEQFKIVLQDATGLSVSPGPLLEPSLPWQPGAGQFTVATFNVNNHFDTQRDRPDTAEPIVPATDLHRKEKKLAATIGETLGCPTVVALQEVENQPLLEALAARTAEHCGFTYAVAHHESVDSRGLDLALLTDPRRVDLLAVSLQQACTSLDTGLPDGAALCRAGQYPLFSRPPLRVDLQIDGHPYVIINNHFKSKREGEEETAARRLAQAEHIADLAGQLRAADPQVSLITLGDFNDYERSPTMRQMTAPGDLFNILEQIPLEERYTYIFDGFPQLIDGILVSPALLPALAGVTIAHVNADFPVDFSSDDSPTGLPFHASDHDVPLALFNLPSAPATSTPQRPTPTALLPTAVPAAEDTAVPPVSAEAVSPDGPTPRYLFPAAGLLLLLAVVTFAAWRKARSR